MYSIFQKKIVAFLTMIAILVSTLAVDGLYSIAAEAVSLGSSYTGSMDGDDVSDSDVTGSDVSKPDAGSTDGEDVSGADVLTNIQQQAFLVTDETGAVWGSYEDWNALVADFKAKGDVRQAYVISVSEEGIIGKTMPSKAAVITLMPASGAEGELFFANGTLNMTTPLVIEAKSLCVTDTGKAVNVNTKGKQLTLKEISVIGNVKGTSKGTLVLDGDVTVTGNLQTFKSVNVNRSLQVAGNVSGVTDLVLNGSTVYPAAGKSFTVTNVDATAGGVLGFPAEGTFPKAKIGGKVSGILDLKLFREGTEGPEELGFAAGSKLLTAPKATVEQFRLAGEDQCCYKKSNVLYVGAEVLMLYSGADYLDTYSRWSDVKTRINTIKDKTAEYTVVLLDDYVENGALSMPTKGRYAKLTFENGGEKYINLKATGGLTLTADTVLGAGLALNVSQINGTAWGLHVGTESSVVTKGNVAVKNLILGTSARVQTGGKLTVKNHLDALGDNELVLTHKKGAALKNTVAADRIRLRLIDKNGSYVTPAVNTTILTATGTSSVWQFRLGDAQGQELPLYTKGTAMKVRGDLEAPIKVYRSIGSGKEYLGAYTSLAEVKAAIGRFKVSEATYYVEFEKEQFVKGALPLPKAGTYKQIVFSGEPISTTGNIALTGDTVFHNKIQKVKSQTQDTPLSMNWNLSKYTLTIPEGSVCENMGNVTGSAKSGLQIMGGDKQVINGNLKVDELLLAGGLQVKGTITVTNIKALSGNRLDYDLARSVAIKGVVEGEEPLVLNPLRADAQSVYTDGMKVLTNAPNLSVNSLRMAQDTDWVLYKDGSTIRLGKALMTVFENTLEHESVQSAERTTEKQFARINDAIDYINESQTTDFVIRLEDNVPSAGAFKSAAQGKNIAVCGLNGERKTLNLTGSITVNGGSFHVCNVVLKNAATVPGVVLKNQASLHLQDTSINTLSAPAGTSVMLVGTSEIKGTVTGACHMTIVENGVLKLGGNATIDTLTLDGAQESTAQLRLRLGKNMTVNNAVNTPEDGYFIINRVDANDKLADISVGTVMVITPQGKATQFKTENIMPGSFLPWNLIKKGDNIQTSEASQGDGEWSGDYL